MRKRCYNWRRGLSVFNVLRPGLGDLTCDIEPAGSWTPLWCGRMIQPRWTWMAGPADAAPVMEKKTPWLAGQEPTGPLRAARVGDVDPVCLSAPGPLGFHGKRPIAIQSATTQRAARSELWRPTYRVPVRVHPRRFQSGSRHNAGRSLPKVRSLRPRRPYSAPAATDTQQR